MLEDILRACVLDQPGSWGRYIPLVAFVYNNSFHVSIRMTLYEALYRRKYQSPLCWYEASESSVLEPNLVAETTEKINCVELESIELKEILTFQVTPVRIDDTSVEKLNEKEVLLVKVAWKRARMEEHTWELELEMWKDYPEIFSEAYFERQDVAADHEGVRHPRAYPRTPMTDTSAKSGSHGGTHPLAPCLCVTRGDTQRFAE
ncbi:uncharacterized protein [Arachis hypogaea]|uniref:uncharacterized protein n=1 Tax=Arachis hypogaea TaxID=3818 RepID=UPI003B220DB2